MTHYADFLVEILCEELPPKSLLKLAQAFANQLEQNLSAAQLNSHAIKFYATPRRLAVFVEKLASHQPHIQQQRRGPALAAAFDENKQPTKACLAFAQSCGVNIEQLETLQTEKGSWLVFNSIAGGKPTQDLLPSIVQQALKNLPIATPMRWEDHDFSFVRPVHSVIMLYGDDIVNCEILGVHSGRETLGHRFHSSGKITVASPHEYVEILRKAFVIVDFAERQNIIKKQILKKAAEYSAAAEIKQELLDEVTGLVEWPVALLGKFSDKFLQLPQEVLICSMRTHQRYFPLFDEKARPSKLMPYFITISNIESHDPVQVIQGNERVINARLSDADFFYHTDLQTPLVEYVPKLGSITFQAELGSLFAKTQRISKLAQHIAKLIGADEVKTQRAGYLAKADLLTNMVGEFPELQGVIGYYYAKHAGDEEEVAEAVRDHYLPKFAGDMHPVSKISQALAIADRLDTLTGIFGINKAPTGDKDPFALRRAALGILRIIIKREIDLDLAELLPVAVSNYEIKLPNKNLLLQLLNFFHERLHNWCLDEKFSPDVIAAINAKNITKPWDYHKRIIAMQDFRNLPEAESLAAAHKRVNNLLAKQTQNHISNKVDEKFLIESAEQHLFKHLQKVTPKLNELYEKTEYTALLKHLAQLRPLVDDFFTQVMVMTDDEKIRHNRLALLAQLRYLFLLVGDISLLQM